jgi:hypothetical protein
MMEPKIKIPERVKDFTEQHRRFIWLKILGGKIDEEFTTWYENGKYHADKKWILNDCKYGSNWFHPEREIECAEMLNGWLVKKKLGMQITIRQDGNIYVDIFDVDGRMIEGVICRKKEEYARTTAILKAYLKMEEE